MFRWELLQPSGYIKMLMNFLFWKYLREACHLIVRLEYENVIIFKSSLFIYCFGVKSSARPLEVSNKGCVCRFLYTYLWNIDHWSTLPMDQKYLQYHYSKHFCNLHQSGKQMEWCRLSVRVNRKCKSYLGKILPRKKVGMIEQNVDRLWLSPFPKPCGSRQEKLTHPREGSVRPRIIRGAVTN